MASEDFIRNLEFQFRVDTYLVLIFFIAFFCKTQRIARTGRSLLRFHLFLSDTPACLMASTLRAAWMKSAYSTRSITQAKKSTSSSSCRPNSISTESWSGLYKSASGHHGVSLRT